MADRVETFWLKANAIPGSAWTRVSREDWIRAERAAGFRPKGGGTGPATGGFSDSSGISGCIRPDETVPTH